MPIIETAAALGLSVGKVAASSVAKSAATKLVKEFNSKVVDPFFSKRKAQGVLINGVKRYLRICEKKTRFVPTIAIQGSKFALDDIYEPLTLMRTEDRQEFEVLGFPSEILAKSQCVLITDSAGMGKSTLAKFILRRSLEALDYIPIMVELRRIKSGQSLESFICEELIGSDATDSCRKNLLESFESGRFLFIFDGYDEIDDEIRQDVSASISKMSSEYAECCFWLTSRPDSGLSSFSGFLEYRIKPLSQVKAHSLLRRYDAGRGKADSLIAKLAGLNQVSEFLGNPLLVTLLYKAYDYKATIPLKRNIFFRQVYDALYQDHDLSKEGAFERRKKSSLDGDDFHKALRALGIVTFKFGRVQYGAEDFSELLAQAARLASSLKVDVGRWKADLLSAVPIFARDGPDIRWTHKAFQDYFSAQFVFYDMGVRREEFVKRILSDDNPQKNENILMLLAELDLEMVRNGYIRKYAIDLVNEAEALGMTGSEVDFSLFMAKKCGEFFILAPDFQMDGDSFSLETFPSFMKYVSNFMDRDIAFRRANMSLYSPYQVVGVYHDNFAFKQQLLARIDPATFSMPPFLRGFDKKRDSAVVANFLKNGWFNVNDAIEESGDIETKESLARLVGGCVMWSLPSLASVKLLLGSQQEQRRAESIDDLLEGL